MSLEPFFSLSPLDPYVYTYDAANPNAPYASARIDAYGVFLGWGGFNSLQGQHSENKALLAMDPAPASEQSITSTINDICRRSAIRMAFNGKNISVSNQYLLIFRLARTYGQPVAQFFVGNSLVRAETLTSNVDEDIAILLDTPGNGIWVYVVVRLAETTGYFNGFFFKGVDCYLL